MDSSLITESLIKACSSPSTQIPKSSISHEEKGEDQDVEGEEDEIWFKLEPPIVAVCARNPLAAQRLIEVILSLLDQTHA